MKGVQTFAFGFWSFREMSTPSMVGGQVPGIGGLYVMTIGFAGLAEWEPRIPQRPSNDYQGTSNISFKGPQETT